MNKVIKTLLVADNLAVFALAMVGPIYAIFVEQIGGNILDASFTYFIFMITSGIVMYLLSLWEDRDEHKEKFIVIGYVLAAIGVLSYIFVSDQVSLLITQMILGLSTAVTLPAIDAVFSKNVNENKRVTEWGTWESSNTIIGAVSVLVGGYIAHIYGFKILFALMFVFIFVSAVLSTELLKK